jgi:hypothetical protein
MPGLDPAIPAHLLERSRIVSPCAEPCDGPRHDDAHRDERCVLYWTHHALRIDENPALEAAASIASSHGRSLLVCAAVSGAHPLMTDRHAVFFLEGIRDFALELAAVGVPLALSLDAQEPVVEFVARLAERAAIVVTDDFPAQPSPAWMSALAARIGCPLVAVDGACVVPLGATDRAFDRAFAFRDATASERARQLAAPLRGPDWSRVRGAARDTEPAVADWRAFDPLAAVASMEIDHSVAPVVDTVGGSRAAQARWSAFLDGPIDRYARDRNDAALVATSRLSAYLHFGMIAPMRVAREALARGGEGAEKFLDELLVWRELAYHWCHREPAHTSMAAIPAWARATLAARAGDARDVRSREQLARGASGVRLWDLAQRSLVIHGELHNNLRMTWGKAIPMWTASPERALETLIELNDRFALDGADPSSYAGLLWCLGLFDRPFAPEAEVLGRVRPRSIAQHAERLDLDGFERIVRRPAHRLRVAVIGSGIAGSACARTLAEHGVSVTLLEKSRGPGGRMSTRRGDAGAFDHGAQYFSVRDPRFRARVDGWVEEGVAARWDARFAELCEHGCSAIDGSDRFVGVPGMSAVCAHLARGIPIETSTRVKALVREGDAWIAGVVDDAGNERRLGPFDVVLTTAPAPQSAELLAPVAPALAAHARSSAMQPMWALMLAGPARVELPFDHAQVHRAQDPLAWISRVSSKPGRTQDGIDRWVVLARADWTDAHLEAPASLVADALLAAFTATCAGLGIDAPRPDHAVAHRWRHALPTGERGPSSAFDDERNLGMAGDWMRGSRVEDAYLSGVALAGRVLAASVRSARAAVPRSGE